MADHSSIEWTDATWNPVTGCKVKSPGCAVCYAMQLAGTRLKNHPSRQGLTVDSKAGPVWTGEVRFNEGWLYQPLRWSRPRMIFVCAHADLFYEAVPDGWVDRVFAAMALAPQHTFQVLTKRPDRMLEYLTHPMTKARIAMAMARLTVSQSVEAIIRGREIVAAIDSGASWPLPGVLIGVSVEDQRRADERRLPMQQLVDAAGWPTWVSYEPALGPVDWHGWEFIRWMVSGGESDTDGESARPSHPAWHRAARDFCSAHDIAFNFKQWGSWKPVCQMSDAECDALYLAAPARYPLSSHRCKVENAVLHADGRKLQHGLPDAFVAGAGSMSIYRVGKKASGRKLDGIEHNGFPQVRP